MTDRSNIPLPSLEESGLGSVASGLAPLVASREAVGVDATPSGHVADDHFADVGKMVPLGSGAEREVEDIARKASSPDDRSRPSSLGAVLGVALYQLAEAGRRALGTTEDLMCATCAFRPGSMPNQMGETGLVAFKCAIGADPEPFGCHHGLALDGQPSRLCAGFVAAKHAPWEVAKEISARMAELLPQTLAAEDVVRAEFDAWAAKVDPDNRMHDYERARLWMRRAKRTEDGSQTPSASDGEGISEGDMPTEPKFNQDGRELILPTTTEAGPGFDELKDRWRR